MMAVITTTDVLERIQGGEMFRRSNWHNGLVAVYAKEVSGFFEPMIMTLSNNWILENPLNFRRSDWFANDWVKVEKLPGEPGQTIEEIPEKRPAIRRTPRPKKKIKMKARSKAKTSRSVTQKKASKK